MHYSAKQRRNSHSGRKTRHNRQSGGKNAAAFVPTDKSGPGLFLNVKFVTRPWFKDMEESREATITNIQHGSGNKKTGTLTVKINDDNKAKFKISNPVVENVEFTMNEGAWISDIVSIKGSAFGRPDISRVAYVKSGSDFVKARFTEGGGALMGQVEDSASSSSQSADAFFKNLGSNINNVKV